jgi:hypothetical protein
VQLADPGEQLLLLDRAGRAAAASPLVIRGHRHAQGLADRLDPEAATMLVDVAAHLGWSGSSSLAKNTLADFKVSFARRNSKFSWRKRLISSRSALVGRSGLQTFGLGLARSLAKRLPVDAQIVGDVRDRTSALERRTDAALKQLLWVLPRSRHDAETSSPQDSVLVQRSPAKPVRLTRFLGRSNVPTPPTRPPAIVEEPLLKPEERIDTWRYSENW